MTKLNRLIQASTSRFQGKRSKIWILLLYVALSVVMTWPLIITLGERIPVGYSGDAWSHLWTHSWVKQSLAGGNNLFFTDLIYFPSGISLATHNIPWVNIALWLPLQAIIGTYAAYSLLYIALFAFNSFAMYLFVLDWYKSIPAAIIAGIIYGFFPYVVSRSGQPNWIMVAWLPLALLFLKRTVEDGRIRDAVISGALIALIGISRWHLLILSSIPIAIYLVFLYSKYRSSFSRRTLILLAICATVALLLMIPFAWPFVKELFIDGNVETDLVSVTKVKSTNLLAYFVPNGNMTIGQILFTHLPYHMRFSTNRIEFVGIIVLALAAIGSVANWKKAWPWLLILSILVLFAMGPVLKVGTLQLTLIPMPYRFLENFLLLRVLRHASRFNILVGFPLAMLAALGVLKLQQTRFGSKHSFLLTITLGFLILTEYMQIPYLSEAVSIPSWYEQLAQEQEEFAILDLPMHPGGRDKQYMHYQMTHGKPLVSGHVSRFTKDALAFIEDSSILSGIRQDNAFGASNIDVSHQLNGLADSGVKYIILHKQFVTESKIEEWKDWLTGQPYHEDDDLVVYRTDLFQDGQLKFEHKLTEDIGLIEVDYWPEQIEQTDPIRFKLRWGASQRPINEYDACIQLINDDRQVSQEDCSAISKEWPTRKWQKNEVVRGDFDLRIDPFLEPGNYSLWLILMNRDQEVGEQLVLGTIKVDARPRIFKIEESPIPADAIWANQISLLGHESSQDDETLRVTLYWQALKRIDKSHKYFIHLIDLASGQVVAQVDAIPQDWTYPTDWWEEGEIVIEAVSIPLSEVDPGNYWLQVGFYDEVSGERLIASSSSGQPYSNNTVILTEFKLP